MFYDGVLEITEVDNPFEKLFYWTHTLVATNNWIQGELVRMKASLKLTAANRESRRARNFFLQDCAPHYSCFIVEKLEYAPREGFEHVENGIRMILYHDPVDVFIDCHQFNR